MVAFEHPHPHGALAPTAHLELPFFDDAHRALANGLVAWTREQRVDESDDRAACKEWVQRLGAAGWLRYCVPEAHGGALPELDSRALVILRETLAYHSPLADFAFAMQGLGSGVITLAGTSVQQATYLHAVASGRIPPEAKVFQLRDNAGPVLLNKRVLASGDEMVNARLVVIEDSRHATPMDQPEAFNQQLLQFLTELDGTSQPVNPPMKKTRKQKP